MSTSDLHINFVGVRHYGRIQKLVRELEKYVTEDTDAIFLERSPAKESWRTKLKAFVLNPAIFIFLYSYKYISILFVLLKNRQTEAADALAAQEVAEQYDIPVHDVDKSIYQVIVDQSWAWLFLSWVFFAFFVVEIYNSASVGVVAFLGAFFQAVFAILILIGYPVLLTTISDRNAVMYARILRISKENGYNRVCMLTGAMHLNKFGEYADETGTNHELIEVEYTTRKLWNRIKNGAAKIRNSISK